jgi:hypothetical protein
VTRTVLAVLVACASSPPPPPPSAHVPPPPDDPAAMLASLRRDLDAARTCDERERVAANYLPRIHALPAHTAGAFPWRRDAGSLAIGYANPFPDCDDRPTPAVTDMVDTLAGVGDH